MATIQLYADKVNRMTGLLTDAKKLVSGLKTDITSFNKTTGCIDAGFCDMESISGKISSTLNIIDIDSDSLDSLATDIDDFIESTRNTDLEVSELIVKAKKEFYEEYSYLKPEEEKTKWEKFKDGCKKAGEWCKEHWKEILLAVEIIVAVVCLFIPGMQGFGFLLLKHIAIGILKGLVIGAIIGGIAGYAQYGVKGILGGMLSGAKDGAIYGGIFGGMGQIGALLGTGMKCSALLTSVNVVSKILCFGTVGFDILALSEMAIMRFNHDTGLNIFNTGGFFADLNKKAHSSTAYNVFQFMVSVTAVTTSGMRSTAACFIAGTIIHTVSGMMPIEQIKAGDTVISTNPDTMETGNKKVVETYIRKVDRLVYLTVNGEKIVTTVDHPFYVKNRGFVNAADLKKGDELFDVDGNVLCIEEHSIEFTEETTVYNFQVEDYHTYHVGKFGVMVHNAENYVGKNGTQTSSTTVWKHGETERIDVENPSPGKRSGNIHYHDVNDKKFYYDIGKQMFVIPKTGAPAPKNIQKLLSNSSIKAGINKGLNVLGE